MDPVPRSKLPTFGVEDGDQVIDSAGNIYEFDTNTRTWIYRGAIESPPAVGEEIDGLVSPDVFRKLALLQQLISQGVDFTNFKLSTEAGNPYYYYFNSSDDLIKFTPEQIPTPKETKLSSTILDLGIDSGNTFLSIENALFSSKELVGLELETDLGNFRIVDNSNDVVVIAGDPGLRIGDRVRIVKSEQIQTRLRIEVDRGRLYQKLVRQCCVGPKGRKGEQGFPGPDGDPANDEIFQLPIDTTSGSFSWSTIVKTPIDTPISLRIFRQDDDNNPVIEVLYSIAGTETTTVIISDETIQIEETSLVVDYEPTSEIFSGSLTIISGGDDLSAWRYKARQQGPKGPAGRAGKAFLEIVTQLLDDPTVRSQEAIITFRKAVASDDIITLRAPLFENVPANNLAAFDGDSIKNVLEDLFMAAKVTIRESKDIQTYQFIPPEIPIPALNLPSWTPTPDCVQARRWVQYRFDWFDRVEPKYLFHILPTPKPPEQCCQEDFFFCPNLGDACPPEGEIAPPTPIPVPCECECENPLSGQFYGGALTLNPIDLTDPENFVNQNGGNSNGASQDDLSNVVVEDPNAIIPQENVQASAINIAESVIDGNIQTFEQEITLLGNADIRVMLDYDADVCGGIEVERSTKGFVDSDNIQSLITLTDPTGQANVSNDGTWETNTVPVAVAFTVQAPIITVEDVPPETQLGEIACPVDELIQNNLAINDDDIEDPGDLPIGDIEDPVDLPVGEDTPTIPNLTTTPPVPTTTIGTPVTVTVTVQVNVGGSNYCRGYRLTIIARSDRTAIDIPRTYITVPEGTRTIPSSLDPRTNTDDGSDLFFASEGEPIVVREGTQLVIDKRTSTTGKIDIPPGTDQPPPVIDDFIPPTSFASDGFIIGQGTADNAPDSFVDLIDCGKYVITIPTDGGFIGGGGDFGLPIGLDFGDNFGQLLKSQDTPIHQDLLNFNVEFDVQQFPLNPTDAAYDQNGLFGIGTYILGFGFNSLISSISPEIDIRLDRWTNVIGFINQPQTADDTPEQLTIIARLESSDLINPANSAFAHSLFESGLTEGVITISLTNPSQPINEAITNGEIVFFGSGSVTISYYGTELAGKYPQIFIIPTQPPPPTQPGPPPPEPPQPPPKSCIGTINNFQIFSTPSTTGASSTYEFDLTYDFAIPEDAIFVIDFAAGIDISGVNSGSISSLVMDGSFSVSVFGQQMAISRVGGTNCPTTNANFFIGDIVNPAVSGSYNVDLTVEDASNGDVCDGPIGAIITITGAVIGDPNIINIVSGNGQTATVKTVPTNPLVVEVLDVGLNPVVGAQVNATIITGSGTISANEITDGSGQADFTDWTLGTTSGLNEVEFTVDGFPGAGSVIFQATGEPGAAAAIAIESGNGQSAEINTALPAPMVVVVTDNCGNPVAAGVSVTWTVTEGGGSLGSGAVTFTNASGLASNTLTVGAVAGVNNNDVRAEITALPAENVTFEHSATAPPAGKNITAFDYFVIQPDNGAPTFPFGTYDELTGVSTTYAHDITTDFNIAADDKIRITFPTGTDLSSATLGFTDLDGTLTLSAVGNVLTAARNGDGTAYPAGLFLFDLDNVVATGTTGSYTQSVEILDVSDTLCAGPEVSASSLTFDTPIDVDLLIIGGFEYPAFQFFQFPNDAGCMYVHWHSPGVVCSTNNGPSFAMDPNPGGCGFGNKTAMGVIPVLVPGPIDPGDPIGTIPETTKKFPATQYANFPGMPPWPACP